MSSFVDRVVLHAFGGDGGHGCTSVHREKFKPLGGPDGGNGGNGGSVILEVDPQETTLLTYHWSPHRRASKGGFGMGDNRNGPNGEDIVLPVPPGTVVQTVDGEILADLVVPGEQLVIAAGGRGGLGNAALASQRRKAPGFHLLGEPGEENDVVLELKTVADVALVGYPSAGKSSLIAALSAARPKIADYPFTTLVPNLGVVEAGSVRYTVADVPGLIPGASEGKGLGLEFLRHVERCAVLVHVLDAATLESDRDPLSDLRIIEQELANYSSDLPDIAGLGPLTERPRVIAINKIDVPDGADMAKILRPELEEFGWPIFEISAVTRKGLRELSFGLAKLVGEFRSSAPQETEERPVLRPRSVNRQQTFTVKKHGSGEHEWYEVLGAQPERWVVQTNFDNEEAVGYLADRLARLGVEEALFKAGAVPGAEVVIGRGNRAMTFDWEPTMITGAERLAGPRGTDVRLADFSERPTRAQKREEFYERMDAKAEARAELDAERRAGKWQEDK